MSRFPTSLPRDIVFEIVFYLDQRDCVELMSSCRQWHLTIPAYVCDLWKTLTFSSTGWKKLNDCILRSLGYHIKHVSIKDGYLVHNLLKKLHSANCPIALLEIRDRDNGFYLQNSKVLMESIQIFGNTLKELCIVNQEPDMSVPWLLGHLPGLTHLTLLTSEGTLKPYIDVSMSESSELHHNLVYLHVDEGYEGHLVPVLSRCPGLMVLCIKTYSKTLKEFPYRETIKDILLGQLCPRLCHFIRGKYSKELILELPKLPARVHQGDNNAKLQQVVFDGDMETIHQIAVVLGDPEANKMLERLELRDITSAGPDHEILIPAPLEFTQLKRLCLRNFRRKAYKWIISIIRGAPKLEHLSLTTLDNRPMHMDEFTREISSIKHLQSLDLGRGMIPIYEDFLDSWNNIRALSENTRLTNLTVVGIGIDYMKLLDLCKIPSLKTMVLKVRRVMHDQINRDEVLGFVDKLNKMDSKLETLKLCYHAQSLDDVLLLDYFAQIRNLSQLYVISPRFIAYDRVKAFFDNAAGTPKMLAITEGPFMRTGFWIKEGRAFRYTSFVASSLQS